VADGWLLYIGNVHFTYFWIPTQNFRFKVPKHLSIVSINTYVWCM